jgi:hypothetical protein
MTNERHTIEAWFSGRLPAEWTTTPPSVEIDREEITVVLTLDVPAVPDSTDEGDQGDEGDGGDGGDEGAARAAAIDGRVSGFREDTRERRIAIAREAEHRFGRSVAWGVEIDGARTLFTHLAVPVMTRLRQPERMVLDTLVAANIARSRSDAVAWCVRLVGRNTDEWLAELRTAMQAVEQVRAGGPDID